MIACESSTIASSVGETICATRLPASSGGGTGQTQAFWNGNGMVAVKVVVEG